MIKNGKYFVPPPKDGGDFKELFKRLTSAGAGRPVDKDGFPQGPWTPDLLADAITQIDARGSGIELRTVQLWFQDNDKGIGTENTRLLARIFGCDDPEATSEWQAALGVARSHFVSRRRNKRRTVESYSPRSVDRAENTPLDISTDIPAGTAQDANTKRSMRRFSLAASSESLFMGSPLNLPVSVFAGAVALGFTSYFLGIHNVSFEQSEGYIKQVGFLWAPNWTFVFIAFMPLFFAFVADILAYWKIERRLNFPSQGGQKESSDAWTRKLEASSYTFWIVFIICIIFAGIFQWISIRLLPLIQGGDEYATDWGRLAIKRPEVITVPEAAMFTGFAYLYMCICFYLFFVGLILLYTIANDLSDIRSASMHPRGADHRRKINKIGIAVMQGIFRCTVLGILVAMCMKLQSTYMASIGSNIVSWLVRDMSLIFGADDEIHNVADYIAPNHFTSLLIVLATCFVFMYGVSRLGVGNSMFIHWAKMSAIIVLLVTSYALIGAFAGFSILLSIGVFLAIYSLLDPGLGTAQLGEQGHKPDVL
ncbi:MAG: hypothetical protein AB3N20_00305 [Rhizobiaceae bacterium]